MAGIIYLCEKKITNFQALIPLCTVYLKITEE